MPCKGKSTEKGEEVEESGRKRGGALLYYKPIFCRNITGNALILLFFTFGSTPESPYAPQE